MRMVNLSDFFTTFKKWSYTKTEIEESFQDELDKLSYKGGVVGFNERVPSNITISIDRDYYFNNEVIVIRGRATGKGTILLYLNGEYYSQGTSDDYGYYTLGAKLGRGEYSFYTIFKQNSKYYSSSSETVNLEVYRIKE